MADIPGYTYIDIVRPDTEATEHVPEDWTYYAGSITGRTIKPGVPWPSEDAPEVASYNDGTGYKNYIVPGSFVDPYGDFLSGKMPPLLMPDGPIDEEPPPEDPDPVFSARAVAVARFLGRDDETTKALAEQHARVVAEYAYAYVQSRCGTREVDGTLTFPRDVEAVVTSATARLVVNPAQVESETADGYAVVGSFVGFTLPERMTLNRYRRRSA